MGYNLFPIEKHVFHWSDQTCIIKNKNIQLLLGIHVNTATRHIQGRLLQKNLYYCTHTPGLMFTLPPPPTTSPDLKIYPVGAICRGLGSFATMISRGASILSHN